MKSSKLFEKYYTYTDCQLADERLTWLNRYQTCKQLSAVFKLKSFLANDDIEKTSEMGRSIDYRNTARYARRVLKVLSSIEWFRRSKTINKHVIYNRPRIAYIITCYPLTPEGIATS